MTTERDDDLHTTTEALREDARRLERLESEKATMSADDPRLPELAAEGVRLAERLRTGALAEQAIIDDVPDQAGADGA